MEDTIGIIIIEGMIKHKGLFMAEMLLIQVNNS